MGQVTDKELERGKVIIRPYAEADQQEIEELFIKGTLEGSGSPLTEALALYRPHVITATACLVLAVLCELFFLNRPLSVLLEDPLILLRRGGPLDHHWIIWLYSLSAGLYIYAYLRRRTVRGFLDWFVEGGLQDLQNIPYTYDQERPHYMNPSPYYLSNGPGGFWVAKVDGQVVGFVGLKTSKKPSDSERPAVWEVSRLVVSQEMRGRRIAQILMDAVYDRARGHNLVSLELTTSQFFHTAANKLYKRNGWVKIREQVVLGVPLQFLQKTL